MQVFVKLLEGGQANRDDNRHLWTALRGMKENKSQYRMERNLNDFGSEIRKQRNPYSPRINRRPSLFFIDS